MASATTESSSIEANAAAPADARGRRQVWNVPPNGAIEVGPVMGAVSWPALSESARASPSDGSASASASAPPGPLVLSPSARPANSPQNPNPIQNPMPPARQRSMRRGSGSSSAGSGSSSASSGSSSGGSTPANGGVGLTLPPVLVENAQSATGRQTVPEPSPRGSRTGGLAPQTHGGGDQHWGYGGNRRGNNGGGSHHNHGNRRDQEWNHHRNAHMHPPQQRGGGGIRSYPRQLPPVISTPFVGPSPPVRSYVGNAMGFPDVHPMYFVASQPSPESLGAVPFIPHPVPPMFFPVMDPQRAQLLKQIDYYFSSENLCKDIFLRQKMDGQGWVPISLIATFNRVQQLTNSIQYILDTVKFSTVVEVQLEKEKKIRRRNDWKTWLIHPSNHLGSTSGGQSQTSSDDDAVATRLQNISLEESTINHIGVRGPICSDLVFTRSASGNLNNQFQAVGDPSRDGNGQFTGFNDSDRLRSSRSLSRSDTL